MTTTRDAQRRRRPFTPFREDTTMVAIDIRYAAAKERIERYRAEAERERITKVTRRPFRRRLGESLMRLGRRVGGDAPADATTAPAWPA
jgi:hypothetical protein